MNISVVVATHADPLGLYLTVYALLQQLQSSQLEWEIVIAADGGTPVKWEKLPRTRCLRISTGSPQGTRDAGIRAARYPLILCVESHVVVSYIEKWIKLHRAFGATISFPARVGETSELFTVNNTETDWDGDLWIKYHLSNKPECHRVAQFGNAAFMLDKDWYEKYGGYTLEQKGWGGEEPYLCLKAWMTGKECWVFPEIEMAHYLKPGAHIDYKQSPDYIRNMDIVRYVMSGSIPPRGRVLPLTPVLQKERQQIIDGPFLGHLNLLREYFKKEGIS